MHPCETFRSGAPHAYFGPPCTPVEERWARDSVAPLWRSSAGWMLARMGRLSADVGRSHPVTIHKMSLMAGSARRVWALRHQTGVQYSAVEWTRAKVAVRNVVAPAPQTKAASRLRVRRVMSTFCEVTRNVQRYSEVFRLGVEGQDLVVVVDFRLASLLWGGGLLTPFS